MLWLADEEDRNTAKDACRGHRPSAKAPSLSARCDVACVRWYVAYSLSLRNLEEMMAERGIEIDHSKVHRWVIKLVPLFEKTFRKYKQPVGKSWRTDETYIKVKGQWKYLYRAVDKAGKTIDFLFRAKRDKWQRGASLKNRSLRTVYPRR